MAYGNNYGKNPNGAKEYNASLKSNYRFSNVDSIVDPSCLSFSMWKSTLRVTINPRKEGSESTTEDGRPIVNFDYNNGGTIYLNHTKARILANELRNFLSDPDTYNGCGVISGQNLISISNGSEYGSDTPVMAIRRIDESGRPISTYAYQFHKDYHGAIRNYINNGDECYKVTDEYDNIEILEFITMLEEYYKAMTNATAFTVVDSMGKDRQNQENSSRLSAICDKLEISTPLNSPSYANNSNNYFNNLPRNNGNYSTPVNPTPYQQASLNDLMDE